ncbi:hypothetical protein TBLA_0F00930 [Henningerozyma blattae CBS 6284]|uniref:U1-type domain-containing protein n=1 Tax=Henningerozyma blattae (strain ATCC 34711 / CBS 6284 / DSM 70876 / NBRC 10599 / NRRL Y-10934 / UCD 77-7) TaxID=1071380 RepID=I2H5I5_HENB6|nr:hypothetical protein TBLA_0F00930 [Tetrapisispora blattae CBS 6284]CCH61637.1 hypothetical protein TBLA_0F00930 [Tetrapisispora blattae CBS 6284]
MDYQNRAGSKKGSGGIASQALQNRAQRKRVDDLLTEGLNIPYSFETRENISEGNDKDQTSQAQANPYIYKNNNGKLVCKLCNTMHVSWTSVQRHLGGKKHGINLMNRDLNNNDHSDLENIKNPKQEQIDILRKNIKTIKGIVPIVKLINVKDAQDRFGFAIQVDYSQKVDTEEAGVINTNQNFPPMVRIISNLEMKNTSKKQDKKYLVISYQPFENISIEIPSDKDIFLPYKHQPEGNYKIDAAIDSLNESCTFWNVNSKVLLYATFFSINPGHLWSNS